MKTLNFFKNPKVAISSITGVAFALNSFTIGALPLSASEVCIDVWNPECDIIPDETGLDGEVAPMTSFNVYVKNNTRSTLFVSVRYYKDIFDQTHSTLDGAGKTVTHTWKTEGYWKVLPGQKVLILDQQDDVVGRNIYFHAHSRDGSTTWTGDYTFLVRGDEKKFFEQDMGSSFVEYTMNFN